MISASHRQQPQLLSRRTLASRRRALFLCCFLPLDKAGIRSQQALAAWRADIYQTVFIVTPNSKGYHHWIPAWSFALCRGLGHQNLFASQFINKPPKLFFLFSLFGHRTTRAGRSNGVPGHGLNGNKAKAGARALREGDCFFAGGRRDDGYIYRGMVAETSGRGPLPGALELDTRRAAGLRPGTGTAS